MSLIRKLSIAGACLTVIGQIAGWGGSDGTAETGAEIAMLVKVFGGAAVAPESEKAGKDKPADPDSLITALTR